MNWWSWTLPESVSTFAPEIDRMYYIILAITGVVFFLTQFALVYFLIRYRHREGRKAEYIHGNVIAEIVWTAVPFFVVLFIALASRGTWNKVKTADGVPENAMEIRIMAKQFEWNITYAGGDDTFGTGDDITSRNRLFVPEDQPILILLESEDVIHSFFLPHLRVKQDVVPGMETFVWFEATEPGDYPIGCAELCGLGHTRMGGTLTVQSGTGFRTWLEEQRETGEDDQ